MGRPEARIEGYLRRQVKAHGGLIRKVRFLGRRGAPDNLVTFTFPRAAFAECKAEGQDIDPRSQQANEIRTLQRYGWPVFVLRSRAEVDRFIEEVRG